MEHRLAALAAGWLAMAPAAERIVPIEEEPRHFLVFQNRHVRVFDVRLPPGYRGLWHTHLHDGVFVNVEASQTTAQDLGGQPVVRPPRKLGETYFLAYTRKPKAHRVDNTGSTPFRVVDVEIHEGCGGAGPEDAPGLTPIVENPRVRVSRVALAPGETVSLPATCGMLVAVSGGRLEFRSPGGADEMAVEPAGFRWRDSFAPLEVTNAGESPFHGVDVLLK